MKIRDLGDSTFEITYTFLGFVMSKQKVFIDYEATFKNFSNYNPMYNKETGEQIRVFKGIKIQDKIEAFKRLNNWNK